MRRSIQVFDTCSRFYFSIDRWGIAIARKRFNEWTVLALLVATVLFFHVERLAAQQKSECRPADFKLALDVGHTPEARGATSARGVAEYYFNLELVGKIDKDLREAGFLRTVVLKAHGIGKEQLRNRIMSANAARPDLLLSIHHDDTQRSYHSRWMVDGAQREYSDNFSGYSIFVSKRNVRFDSSMAFAKFLGSALQKKGLLYTAHHSEDIDGERRILVDRNLGIYLYDNLFVLRYSEAPAVLLKAGIIVNRTEELVLASAEGRRHIAQSVLMAVQQYCAAYMKP